jgi:rare lipoprotein A
MVNIGDTYNGVASWYGKDFHGKKTSNGEIYNMNTLTAAHKTLPMNTMVKVTNKKNGKSVVVRINDRGPFVASRIIDMSRMGALKLDFANEGTAQVKLEVVGFAGNVVADASKLTSKQRSVVIDDFDVQIGAFRNQNGARTYQDSYNYQDGRYKAIIKEGTLDGAAIYRVWLKGFGSEDEARDFISSGKYPGYFIVREK